MPPIPDHCRALLTNKNSQCCQIPVSLFSFPVGRGILHFLYLTTAAQQLLPFPQELVSCMDSKKSV